MTDAFVGEIRMFAGHYAPKDWAFCNGGLLPKSQYQDLFSLIGTIYGPDDDTNFALPDLRGRIPIHQGSGPSLSPQQIGTQGGQETVSLDITQIPSHNHTPQGSDNLANSDNPTGNVLAKRNVGFYKTNPTPAKIINFPANVVGSAGSNTPHLNMQPYLGINFIICLNGNYPTRN